MLFVLFGTVPGLAQTSESLVKIGVLAKRGPEKCLEQWTPTAHYLSSLIPEYSFVIVPLDFKTIKQDVERGAVNFVLANPAIYIDLEFHYGVNRIATMVNLRQGNPFTEFGGVIFTRADRADIKTLADLAGKTFVAVEDNSFGGWIMAWRELVAHGLTPRDDFAALNFAATHDGVVQEVLTGKADAGTVRTDTLERMAQEGLIGLEQFRVIDDHLHDRMEARFSPAFPFLHSTRLYPEWPFAKVQGTSDLLAKRVAVALLNMPADHEAAITAQVAGWTTPLNYQPVHECFRDLEIAPYDRHGAITFSDHVRQYWPVMLLGSLITLLLAAYTFHVLRLNRKLWQSREMLARSRDKLEERVARRTADLSRLNEQLRAEVAERRLAEVESRKAHAELDQIFETTADGMALIDLDCRLQRVNSTFLKMLGFTSDQVVGKKCYDVFPSLRCNTNACPLRQVKGGREETIEFEDEKKRADGTVITCIIAATPLRDLEGRIIGIVESFKDISDRKRDELALAEFAAELSRSNQELQQFAYVASHDLQEPLRMVASYVQLLARRYKGKLDSDADEFIEFAVDGANRMKQLIQDLLSYSRVNSRGKDFALTDCEAVLAQTLLSLQLAIEESGAEVTHDPLPKVMADDSQLGQLFLNLVGNGIKFRGEEPPKVHIGVADQGDAWCFSVRDNGIGIDPQYGERIFEIFQRLHGKNEYSGTGIGLAVSKKIVSRHGGRLWMESSPGAGATFLFTLPKRGDSSHELRPKDGSH